MIIESLGIKFNNISKICKYPTKIFLNYQQQNNRIDIKYCIDATFFKNL